MSSHHIVRENQEPAVVIFNVSNCNNSVLDSALEWSPYVVALSDCVNSLLSRDIKLDIVFGNYSGEQANQLLSIQPHIKFSQPTQDVPLLDILNHLKQNQHKAAYIFGPAEIMTICENSQLDLCVIDGSTKWSLIKEGKVRKWFKEGAAVFLSTNEVAVKDSESNPIDVTKPLVKEGLFDFKSTRPFWLGERIA